MDIIWNDYIEICIKYGKFIENMEIRWNANSLAYLGMGAMHQKQ